MSGDSVFEQSSVEESDESLFGSSSSDDDDSDDNESDVDNSVYLPDETPEQCHERWCREGDGWSHAFCNIYYDENSRADRNDIDARRIDHIGCPDTRLLQLFKRGNWAKMSQAFTQFTALSVLDLSSCKLSVEAVTALFGGSNSHSYPKLGELAFSHNELGASHITALVPFLESRSSLRLLNLDRTGLNDEGARLLSGAFDHVRIESLSFCHNSLGCDGVASLLSAQNARHLDQLYFVGNNEIGENGYNIISQFLKRDDTELEVLNIGTVDVAIAKMLINSVSNRSKLCRLYVRCDYRSMARAVVPNIQNLICNTTNFESLCESNHRICDFGQDSEDTFNESLEKALDINARHHLSIAKRLRSKLRAFYFKGEFDVQPFAKMDVKLMPYVLELVTKIECYSYSDDEEEVEGKFEGILYEARTNKIDDIYRLVRNCHVPELFSFPSPESRVRDLEAEIAALKLTNGQLKSENEELRNGSSSLPNKRTRTSTGN